jgi:hypothetical protein
MILRRVTISLLAAFALVACAPVEAPAQETQGPVEITLSRTICFGFCPDYRVTITSEGNVTYVGRSFVNVRGEQRATVPRAEAARLIARFDEIGFDQLRDAYRANVTDLPTTTVSITRNGRTKTVVDYGGLSAGMPRVVRELQEEIDRVAGTDRWVLRDGQPVRDRPQP